VYVQNVNASKDERIDKVAVEQRRFSVLAQTDAGLVLSDGPRYAVFFVTFLGSD
jgi:hypothetical protein